MKCTDCEHIRNFIAPLNRMMFAFPASFTYEKFKQIIQSLGITPTPGADIDFLEIEVRAGDLGNCAIAWMGGLTGEELSATRVLCLDANQKAEPRDFIRSISLKELIGFVQGRWLVDLIEQDRYFSVLQPIVRRDGQRFGHEALLRGRDINGSILGAGSLLNAARDANLLFSLDLAARHSALVTGARRPSGSGKLFVNFNPASIYDPSYCLRTTDAIVRELGLKPRDIVFEVIESEHVADRFHLRGILTFYRQAGFLVALDDVGAGFSGLTLLSELKPDIIKIDMALVRDIDQDRYKQSIVRHLIGIARETGTTVLAEGIETEAEKAWLIQAEVELLQGYLIGRPSPVDSLAA